MDISETGNVVDRKVWGPWATIGFGLLIGIASIIIQIIIVFAFAIITAVKSPVLDSAQIISDIYARLGLIVSISSIVTAIVCLGLIILIIKVRKNITIKEYLGLKPVTKKTGLVLFAITAAILGVSAGISIIFEIPSSSQFMVDVYKTSACPVLLWIAVVIFTPLLEETFFRGFLFAGFIQSRIGLIGTIIITSLIWTTLHIQYEVYELATIFILGIILGIVRYRTNSLWAPILMHAFNNLLAMIELSFYI